MRRAAIILALLSAGSVLANVILRNGDGGYVGPVNELKCSTGTACSRVGSVGTLTCGCTSLIGPTGPTGAQGDAGTVGPTGPTGAPGTPAPVCGRWEVLVADKCTVIPTCEGVQHLTFDGTSFSCT